MKLTFSALCMLIAGWVLALPAIPETLDREKTLAAVKALTVEQAPDAQQVAVAQLRYVKYEPDGTSTMWVDFWAKALTPAGAQDLRDVPSSYTEGFSETEFQLAEVIRPDGSVVPVDIAANTAEATSNRSMDSNIYDPTSKRKVLTVPRVEVGDTLHVIIAYHSFKTRMPNTYTDVNIFEDSTAPTPYSVYVVHAPKQLPLKSIALINEIPGTMVASTSVQKDGSTLYRWEAHDVPQTIKEDNMPDELASFQRVGVSTYANWEEISKWYWDLCERHLTVTPEIHAKVEELTKGVDPDTQIENLFGFVAQGIRYMGIIAETEAPGFEPHDVALTFNNRYGVCRDKGALLVAMLRDAGFNAFPVIINAGSKRDKAVPMPYFNHAIVAVDKGDRDYLLLDPTDDTARAELPSYLSDCSFLVARPEGEDLLLTPVPPPEENLMAIATDGTLQSDGTLLLSATLTFGGVNDNAYRPLFVKNPLPKVRESFDSMLKRVLPGAELVSLDFSPKDPSDISQPLVVTLSARVSGYAQPDEVGRTLIRLPFLGARFGFVNFLFDGLDQPTRRYDWVINTPCAVQEKLTLRGFSQLGTPQLLPDNPVFRSNGAAYEVVCTRDPANDTITLVRSLELSKKTYSPEDYLALRGFIERYSRAESVQPLFTKDALQDVDAEVLQQRTDIALLPDGSTTLHQSRKIRILTFQAKRTLGELKLTYNPAWESVTLNTADVLMANGDRVSVTPKEISEMDVGSAALSPHYPGLKQKVVSMPAMEVGNTLVQDWTLTRKPGYPLNEGAVFGGSAYPVRESIVSVTLPIERESSFTAVEQNFSAAPFTRTIERTETNVTYTWTFKDLPAVKAERGLPAPELYRPTLQVFTEEARAEALLGKVFEAVDALQTRKNTVAVREEAATLKRDLAKRSDDAILRAVQRFMETRIRTLGPSWESLPFLTLTTPDEVLTEGYGNRLDRLILQKVLLERLGIDSQLVFACSIPDKEVAAYPDTFGLSILTWENWARPYLLLDDGRLVGDEGRFDEPGACALEACQLLTEKGRIAWQPQESLRSRVDNNITEITLSPTGEATISASSDTFGLAAGMLRKAKDELTPIYYQRMVQSQVESIAKGAELVGDYIMDTDSYPVHVGITVKAQAYAQRQGNLFSLPLRGVVTPVYGLRGQNRRNPIWQSEEATTVEVTRVTLPEGAEIVSMPEPFTYTLQGGGTYSLAVAREGQTITFTTTLQKDPAFIQAWHFPALVELDRVLQAPTHHTLLYRVR